MIVFTNLDKRQKDYWLPMLFDLLYENMQDIAPDPMPRERAKQLWLKEVSPALDKDPRQIILCFADDVLAGYVQYYTNKDLLMIEEMQIVKPYRGTTVFYGFCKHLGKLLPKGIERIEAYADPRNLHSIALMKKLGMTGETEGKFLHLRGCIATVRRIFK